MVLFLRRLVTVLGLIAGLVVAQAAAPQEKAPRAATPPAPTPQAPDDALAGTR